MPPTPPRSPTKQSLSVTSCLSINIEDSEQEQERLLNINEITSHKPHPLQLTSDVEHGCRPSVTVMEKSEEKVNYLKPRPIPRRFGALKHSELADCTTTTNCSSGRQKEWCDGTSFPSRFESPTPGPRDREKFPVPDGNPSSTSHLLTAGNYSRPFLPGTDGSSLHMRGGSGPALNSWGSKGTTVSMFGIRQPVGDVERGKKLLDKSIGFGWYCAGGPKWGTTYRTANKLTRERLEEEKRLQIEKQAKEEVKNEEKVRKKEDDKKNKEKDKTGLVAKLKRSLSKSKDKKCVAVFVEVEGNGEGADGAEP